MNGEFRIEPLSPKHNRAAFICNHPDLDRYLQRQARQDVDRNLAAVFILTVDGETVAGFYTLSAHLIKAGDFPSAMAKKLPRLPLPATLLGRMAVSHALQGRRLGELLLLHALERAWRSSLQVASLAVIVDAKAGAHGFYRKHGFLSMPEQPDRLYMTMDEIDKIFAR